MNFQGSSNRLAVTLRHGHQVMPCSVPTEQVPRTRSIWLSSRRPSQENHPTSPLEEAASAPVGSQTAWQGIFTHSHLERGQAILIHGGAGAVGAYAVQLASHADATVIAPASGDDEAYLNSLGASWVIDYREAQFEQVLREKVDVVFDLIGGETQKRPFLVLKEGGHLVAATQPVSQEETARHRVTGAMMRLAPSADVLSRIAGLLEEGTIRPDLATVYAPYTNSSIVGVLCACPAKGETGAGRAISGTRLSFVSTIVIYPPSSFLTLTFADAETSGSLEFAEIPGEVFQSSDRPASTRILSKASQCSIELHSMVVVSFVLSLSSVKTSVPRFGARRKHPRGEHEPFRRRYFAVRACKGVSAPAGAAMDPSKCSIWPKVDLADGKRHTARIPPMRDVLGLGPGFEDESARRIEDARDHDLAVGRCCNAGCFGVLHD